MEREARYRMLRQTNPEAFERLMQAAQDAVLERWRRYERMVHMWAPEET